jgi:peptide/nickel transport system substrate-binding protein
MRHTVGLLLVVGLLVVQGACAPARDTSSAQPQGARAAAGPAASGQPAGKLTVGISSLGTAEAWLPWLEAGREGWLVLDPIYESVVAPNVQTGEIEAQLAERWEVDETGKHWRFFLRRGVPFQDGHGEVTAEDVKYSYDMYLTDRSVASNKATLQTLVEQVEVVNPYEIVFHLKQPDVTFLGRLTPGNFGVVSKQYVESVGEREAANKPIGTGPFKLVEHKRQQSVTLEAVNPHWRETPRFQTLLLRRVPDQAARLAMLRAGEIDITEIPFKLKREADAAGLQFLRVEGAAIYHVQLGGQMVPSREPFDPTVPWVGAPGDAASQERALKVRRALNLAVDRQVIINSVFEGEGVPGVVPFYLPGGEFAPPGLQPYAYDPQEAKRLLAEAGYAQGFSREIEMQLMPWPGRAEMVDVGEAVAGFWERNLGLKVKRTPIDFATWVPNVGVPRKTAWVTWAHGYIPRPVSEPLIGMETWLTSQSRYNTVAETPEIDALAVKIRGDLDHAKRVQDYRELAQAIYNQYYAVPIASVPTLYAYNPKMISAWPLQPGESYIGGYERAQPAR